MSDLLIARHQRVLLRTIQGQQQDPESSAGA